MNLRVDTVQLPNGEKSTREVVEHREVVVVVAVDADGMVLLVRQFRYPLDREILEIPAGGVDSGPGPLQVDRINIGSQHFKLWKIIITFLQAFPDNLKAVCFLSAGTAGRPYFNFSCPGFPFRKIYFRQTTWRK